MTRQFKIRSVWFRSFISIFIFMILPIMVFSYVSEKSNIASSLEQKQQSDLNSIQELAETMSVFLESVESLGSFISSDPAVHRFLAAARERAAEDRAQYLEMEAAPYLNHYTMHFPAVIGASLMDRDGYLIGEQQFSRDRLNYYYNVTYMKNVSETQVTWTDPFTIERLEDSSTYRVISALTPVRDENGSFLGYTILYVETSRLKEFVDALENRFYILDASDYIVASKEDAPFYYSLYQCLEISYGLLLEDKSVIVSLDEGSAIVTTRTFDRVDLKIILVSSYNDFRKSVTHSFPSPTMLTIYGMVFAGIASALIAKLLSKPILKLKKTIEKAAGGNLDVRYKTKASDEIAILGNAFNSFLDTIQELMDTNIEQQKRRQKMQLQMIQEQVKPHFLYNVLEMINSLIRSGLTDREVLHTAQQSILHLASFYRISLSSGSDIIDIRKEVQLTENYLALQKLRYIEFMDFMISISPSIRRYSIPKLTLQPIIENAIYHGLKEKCEKGMLCVSGYMEQERIIFEVYDTGCGIPEERLLELRDSISSDAESANHFGLASVVKRLQLLCSDEAKITIDSRLNEYTCVTISFPAVCK